MKYIAFDLNGILDKLSEKLFEFNKALSEIIMNHKVFCQKTSLPGKFKEDRMAERVQSGIDGWAEQSLEVKRLIHDHLALFYHFRKHELISL